MLTTPVLTTMRARDPAETHRPATPLELLFDLTFVVAIAAVVPEFAHAIVEGHPLEGLVGYLLAFFAIWWAWMNFTWFASAFDCDDALYRVLTFVQMAGVLVLAAGLVAGLLLPEPSAFAFKVFFLGCVIVAGIYGGATVSRRILLVQALPAALALGAVLLAG